MGVPVQFDPPTQAELEEQLSGCLQEIVTVQSPTLTEQKLCEMVKLLEEPPLVGIENTSFCSVRDADGVKGHIEIIRDEEGALTEYIFHGFGEVPTSIGTSTAGFSACEADKQPVPTGEVVTDEASAHCGKPIFQCVENGTVKCYVRNQTTKTLEEITVSESEINVPGAEGSKVFESEILELIQVQADNPVATVADAIALAVAAGLPDLVCKETGQVTPSAEADICAYKVRRVPCGASYLTDPADADTAVEVGADDAYYVGGVSINVAEDSYGAVDPARPVAAGADAVAVWCFKMQRELSKAQIAAL